MGLGGGGAAGRRGGVAEGRRGGGAKGRRAGRAKGRKGAGAEGRRGGLCVFVSGCPGLCQQCGFYFSAIYTLFIILLNLFW